MVQIGIIVTLVMAIVAAVSGVVVVTNGGIKNSRTLAFSVVLFLAAIWSLFIVLFLTVRDVAWIQPISVTHYIASCGVAAVFFLFAMTYAVRLKWWHVLLILAPYALLATNLAISPQNLFVSFTLATKTTNTIATLNNSYYILYIAVFAAYFLASIIVLVIALVSKKKNTVIPRNQKRQVLRILVGFILAIVVGSIFNMWLPLVGNYRLIWIGPLGVALYMMAIYPVLMAGKIFNIRESALRLLSYSIVIAAVVAVYMIIFDTVFRRLFSGYDPSWEIYAVNIIMLVVGIIALPLINRTNYFLTHTFYSDAYRVDTVISELNKHIVKNHDTAKLLTRVARLINNTLKTKFVTFVAKSGSGDAWVSYSHPSRSLPMLSRQIITDFVTSSDQRILFVDALYGDALPLITLKKHRVALIVQVSYEPNSAENDNPDDIVGYILIGGKKKRRGNFIQKDIDMLESISNLMAIAIENANYYQQIRSFDEHLRASIKTATLQLRKSNRKLQALDTSKDEFISMASHQLRTPLTSIKGYLSMMLDGDSGALSATQRHFLGEAYQSSLRMARIIGELLDVSRIQTGKFVVDVSKQDLVRIIIEEAAHLADDAKNRQLDLKVDIEPGDYVVPVDDLKIRQTISNLIDNALFYSNAGGKVIVRLSQTPSRVTVEVIDTGIGVPKGELGMLFTKFSRASNAQKRRPDGTGVGLFLARKVVVSLGGNVIVKSVEGKGSTFGFWLPRK